MEDSRKRRRLYKKMMEFVNTESDVKLFDITETQIPARNIPQNSNLKSVSTLHRRDDVQVSDVTVSSRSKDDVTTDTSMAREHIENDIITPLVVLPASHKPIITSQSMTSTNWLSPAKHMTSSNDVMLDKLTSRLSRSSAYGHLTYKDKPTLILGTEGILNNPLATVVDRISGNIYVANNGYKQISVFSSGGRSLYSYDVLSHPWDLAMTSHGLVVALLDDRISMYSTWASLVHTVGGTDSNSIDLYDSHGVATDRNGQMYVCDTDKHRILVLDESGSLMHVFGPRSLYRPVSVAVHPHTLNIYVANQNLVNIYNSRFVYQSSISRAHIPGVHSFSPRYVAFSDDGVLCISDYSNGCLHLMYNGAYIQTLGAPGTGPGQLSYPRGVAFTDTGDLIVCDVNNHRVQIFTRQ